MVSGWVWPKFKTTMEARASTVAIVHGSVAVTFADLLNAGQFFAGQLTDVEPGDRVIVCCNNSPAVPALVAGIWARGAIPTLVHTDAPLQHLLHAIETTKPKAVFTDRDEAYDVADAQHHQLLWPDVDRLGSVVEDDTRSGKDAASIVFTSGSSGPPKGVTQSSENLIDGARRMTQLMSYAPEDRILCPIPFAFDYGWGQVLSLLLEGIPLVLPEPRNAFGLCDALRDHSPTILAGVPAVLGELTAGLAPIREVPRGSIRLITSTGSKMPAGTMESVRDLFPDAGLSLNYGLTETYRSASLPPEMADQYPGSAGFAVPDVDLSIRRQDGSLADPEEEGEIHHTGAGSFLGYWNDPERTRDVLSICPDTGVPTVRTGDLGRMDKDGRLFVHGRRDRQLKSMGVRVAPDEVETLLMESKLLSAAAVTSVPHDMVGDFIVACVVAQNPDMPEKALLKALRVFARGAMSPHMQPRRYVVFEELPSTPSAKTDYPKIAKIVKESA